MKKFAIVNNATHEIEHVYKAEEASVSMFGGKWGNPKSCYHVEVLDEPETLAASFSDLEVRYVEVQTGMQRVPDGDPQPALDASGEPLEDANGNVIMIQDYKQVPVTESQKRAVLKS